MSFQITNLSTADIAKVEIKSDPDFCNVAFKNYNGSGKNLLVFNVPADIASLLAFGFFVGVNRSILVDLDQNPQMLGGAYYEAKYAGRIEVK